MKPVLIAGTTIVNLALVCYTIAIIQLAKKKSIHKNVLLFFSLGVLFDLTATVLMILGSSKGIITAHGLVGYSSLLAMIFETTSLWRFKSKNGLNAELTLNFRKISYAIYTWWVIAYITGAVIVAIRHHHAG